MTQRLRDLPKVFVTVAHAVMNKLLRKESPHFFVLNKNWLSQIKELLSGGGAIGLPFLLAGWKRVERMGGACVTPAERVCERALPAGCGDGDGDGDRVGALTAANPAATLGGRGAREWEAHPVSKKIQKTQLFWCFEAPNSLIIWKEGGDWFSTGQGGKWPQ